MRPLLNGGTLGGRVEMPVSELVQRMQRFLRGEAISVGDANAMESLALALLEQCPELEELADDLAQYRPEGGEFLFDYDQIRPKVAYYLEMLQSRDA
jgi:hypothetical protein